MARKRSKVEACFICNEIPCVCGKEPKPPKKKAVAVEAKSQPKPESIVEVETPRPKRPSFRDAMKAASANSPTMKVEKRSEKVKPKPTFSETNRKPIKVENMRSHDELVFSAALKELGPILHPSERERFAAILDGPVTIAEKTAIWKEARKLDRD